MDRYAAARIVNTLTTILGWAAIGLALLIALGAFGNMTPGLAFTAALPLGLGGLVLIAVAQIVAAQLDTAENTTKMVETLDRVARLLGQDAQRAAVSAPSARPQYAPPPKPRDPLDFEPGQAVMSHKGRIISRAEDGFSVDGKGFSTIAAAKVWIEAEALRKGAGG